MLSFKAIKITRTRLVKNLFTYLDFKNVDAGHAAAATQDFRVPITMKLSKESEKREIQIKIIYIRVATSFPSFPLIHRNKGNSNVKFDAAFLGIGIKNVFRWSVKRKKKNFRAKNRKSKNNKSKLKLDRIFAS